MLTEQFLDICCIVCLSDYTTKNDIVTCISEILEFYEKDMNNIANDSKLKFEFVATLVKLKLQGKSRETIIDDILSVGKFSSFKDLITYYTSFNLEQTTYEDYQKHILLKSKYLVILKNFKELQLFVDKVSSNDYQHLEQALIEYDNIISKSYVDLANEKRKQNVTKISSLNLIEDNFDDVIQQIQVNNLGQWTVTTGFEELDSYMKKGYQPSRLYVFGGASGDGKSTYLINNIINAVEKDNHVSDMLNIYLYLTMENLVDESLLRIYCSWADKDYDKIVNEINVGMKKQIEEFIKGKCRKHNSTVIIEYVVPTTWSPYMIRNWIQTVKDKYRNKGVVRAVYIDYLDLLKSDKEFDMYRLELGLITLLLKSVAVLENVPIITVTQLNREGYDKGTFSLTQMSESMKKVDHSDFVALIKNQDEEEKVSNYYHKLDIFIGKNRCGPKNKKVTLLSRFDRYQIKDNAKSVSLSFDNVKKLHSVQLDSTDIKFNSFIGDDLLDF